MLKAPEPRSLFGAPEPLGIIDGVLGDALIDGVHFGLRRVEDGTGLGLPQFRQPFALPLQL